MLNIKEPKIKYSYVAVLTLFMFFRTVLLAPYACLGLNQAEPHIVITAESVTYCILALMFSLVSSVFFLKIYEQFGEVSAIVSLLIFSEPFLFATQNSCLKLFVDIAAVLCLMNMVNKNSHISNAIILPLFTFLSTVLVPFSVFSYPPLFICMFIIMNYNKEESKGKTNTLAVILSVVTAILGFAVNRILYSATPGFAFFVERFSFSEAYSINKSPKLLIAVIPAAVAGMIFFSKCIAKSKKLNRKNKSSKNFSHITVAFDMSNFLYLLALVGMLFFKSESFRLINTIFPCTVFALTLSKDSICTEVFNNLVVCVKKHKLVSAAVLAVVYYISLSVIDDYTSCGKLISFIRY